MDACQRFVERARKRHAAAAQEAVKKAVEIQSKFEVEVQEGLDRLKRLREEAVASHTSSLRVDPIAEEEAQSRVRAPQEDELPATVHASTAAEINQLRVAVQDLQRDRDFLRSEMAKNRVGRRSVSSDVDIDRPRRFFAERGWIEQVQPIVVIREFSSWIEGSSCRGGITHRISTVAIGWDDQ